MVPAGESAATLEIKTPQAHDLSWFESGVMGAVDIDDRPARKKVQHTCHLDLEFQWGARAGVCKSKRPDLEKTGRCAENQVSLNKTQMGPNRSGALGYTICLAWQKYELESVSLFCMSLMLK